ncbi:hypothetical protein, partial [Escherichia coli]
LLLCHGMVCVVGRMRDLILQLSKSSIYSTKPVYVKNTCVFFENTQQYQVIYVYTVRSKLT